MFSLYRADPKISQEDAISLVDINEIPSYRRFALRRSSDYGSDGKEDKKIWKSKADIYDVYSLIDIQKHPITRRPLSKDELSMIRWKVDNATNIENVLNERGTHDFCQGLTYSIGRVQRNYSDYTFLDLMTIEEKDRNKYIRYILNNITPEDLPCYQNVTREEADNLLSEYEVGTWLIRPSSIKNIEVITADGKEYESGKTYVLTIRRSGGNSHILIYYLRSLGYVGVTGSLQNVFEQRKFHTLEDVFRQADLDLGLYY